MDVEEKLIDEHQQNPNPAVNIKQQQDANIYDEDDDYDNEDNE